MGDPRPKLPSKSNPGSDRDAHYKARSQQDSAAGDGIVFRPLQDEDSHDSESGACSPTLWTGPQFHRPRARSLSPTSRTQAIARGQQELMDMVRNMPDSSYELSLKDLVEYHRLSNPDAETVQDSASAKTAPQTRALVTRSRSVDGAGAGGGFYLKMFFPLPFRPNTAARKIKRKGSLRNDSGLNSSSRVSPKPPPLLRDGSGKTVDRDWWRKRSSSLPAGESEGSVSSGSSNSTSSRNAESQGSCWFCISPMRTKDPE